MSGVLNRNNQSSFPSLPSAKMITQHLAPSLLRRIVRNRNSNASISIATTKPTTKPSRPLRLCGSIFSLSYNHQSAILNHQSNASPITHPLITHAIIYNLSSLTRVVKGKSIKDLTPFLTPFLCNVRVNFSQTYLKFASTLNQR